MRPVTGLKLGQGLLAVTKILQDYNKLAIQRFGIGLAQKLDIRSTHAASQRGLKGLGMNAKMPLPRTGCEAQEKPTPIFCSFLDFVVKNFAKPVTLADLAKPSGLSRYAFCRRFHRQYGVTPMRWLWNLRTLLAHELIRFEPNLSLTEVAFTCGFTSSAHFSRTYRQFFDETASRYKQRIRSETEPNVSRMRQLSMLKTCCEDLVRKMGHATMARATSSAKISPLETIL